MIVDLLSHSAVLRTLSGDPLVGRVDGILQQVSISEHDLQNSEYLPSALGRRIDRFSSLALIASAEIIPKLPLDLDCTRAGVFVGNVYAGWNYGESQLANLVERGPAAVHAYLATAWFPAAAQGEVSIHYGWKGNSKTFSGSDCAVAEALLAATLNLQFNRLDVALVLAAESCLSDFLCWGAGLRSEETMIIEGAVGLLVSRPGLALGPAVSLDVTVEHAPIALPAGRRDRPKPIEHLDCLHRLLDALSRRLSDQARLPLSGDRSIQLKAVRLAQ